MLIYWKERKKERKGERKKKERKKKEENTFEAISERKKDVKIKGYLEQESTTTGDPRATTRSAMSVRWTLQTVFIFLLPTLIRIFFVVVRKILHFSIRLC